MRRKRASATCSIRVPRRNQQAIPAVDYLMKEEKVKRLVLGHDYVYRAPQQDSRSLLEVEGRQAGRIMINYTPFGHSDWDHRRRHQEVSAPPARRRGGLDHHGDANVPSTRSSATRASSYRYSGRRFSWRRRARRHRHQAAARHLAAWNSTSSDQRPRRREVHQGMAAYTKNPKRTTNDPMELLYRLQHVGKAVERPSSTDATSYRRAARHQTPN